MMRISGFSRREPLASGLGLRPRDGVAVEQHLALQVGQIDAVAIEKPERAAAGRRQIQRGGRPQTAGADDEHARRLELLLPGGADLAERQVAPVAFALSS